MSWMGELFSILSEPVDHNKEQQQESSSFNSSDNRAADCQHTMEDKSLSSRHKRSIEPRETVQPTSKRKCGSPQESNDSDVSCESSQSHVTTEETKLDITDLPQSVLLRILSGLSLLDLLFGVSLVCKSWHDLAHDPDLWRKVNLRGQLKVTDQVLLRVTSFSDNVSSVDLTDAKFVTSEGVADMAKQCPHIQILRLCRCSQMRSEAFKAIGQHCSKLRELYLTCCFAMLDEDLAEISSGCQQLNVLRLSQCGNITDTGVKALARSCAQLRSLILDQCSRVTGDSVTALVEGCPDLEKLSCTGCGLTADSLISLTNLKKLKHLELSQVSCVKDSLVIEIARYCPQLQTLNLSLCPGVTDASVDYLARHNKHIRNLYLVSCKLTDKALVSLGSHCKTLSILDVGWCDGITDAGAIQISESCASLTSLGLMRCDKVTIPTTEKLVVKYPGIRYSSMWLDCKRLVQRAQSEGHLTDVSLEPPATCAPPHLM